MNKIYLLVFGLVLASTSKIIAQTYVPFPDSNAIWNVYEYRDQPYSASTTQYLLIGDSTIGNIHYHKLFFSQNKTTFPNDSTYYWGLMREDSVKRIYARNSYMTGDTNDVLLYDFNLGLNDSIVENNGVTQTITSIDSILINNKYRKRYTLDPDWAGKYWIEGIGSTRGLLSSIDPFPTCTCIHSLLCFTQNDTVLYLDQNISNTCLPLLTDISNDYSFKNFIEVFPNPVLSSGLITFPDINKTFSRLEIYNSTGTLINSINVLSKTCYRIDNVDFTAGVYFFRLIDKSGHFLTGKFLII